MECFRNSLLIIILLFCTSALFSQVPEGYYLSVEGKSGANLKTALYNIIKNPNVLAYAQLWEAFERTDAGKNKRNDGTIIPHEHYKKATIRVAFLFRLKPF